MKAATIDNTTLATLFISRKLSLVEIETTLGINRKRLKKAVRDHSQEAANHLINQAYETLEITDPFVFNKNAEHRPASWKSKYTPSARAKTGTKIGRAVAILRKHHENGSLTRANRPFIVKEIQKALSLKNELTAKTYFCDARKLASLEYSN